MSRSPRGWKCTAVAAAAVGTALSFLLINLAACALESGGFGAAGPVESDAGRDAPAPLSDGGIESGVVLPEVCNGEDDDGDGVRDEGCPSCDDVRDGICTGALTFQDEAPGRVLGVPDPRFDYFKEACAGGAVVGASGEESLLRTDMLQVRCAPLGLRREQGDAGFQYRVVWAGPAVNSPNRHGSSGVAAYSVLCEAPRVVVGMTLWPVRSSGNPGVARVDLHCAEIRVEGRPGSWTFSHGEISKVTFGPDSNATPDESPPVAPLFWHGVIGQPVSNVGSTSLQAAGAANQKPVLNLVPSGR